MPHGKVKIGFIADEKTRYRTFQNRGKGLKKKIHELSTLCDVDVCMIMYADGAGSSGPVIWPENRDEAERIINRYLNERKEGDGKRTLNLSDVIGSGKKLQEINGRKMVDLDGLSYEMLMEVLEKLGKKLEDVERMIELRKRDRDKDQEQAIDVMHIPMAYPVVLEDEVLFYDYDHHLNIPGNPGLDYGNWMMMMKKMNTEKQECSGFGGGEGLPAIPVAEYRGGKNVAF